MENINEISDIGWKQYPADDASYRSMKEDVKQAAENADLEENKVQKLLLGMEEAVVNVISYAYEGSGYVWLRTGRDKDFFTLEVVDQGMPFNPLEHKCRSFENMTLKEITPGGLGIQIMKGIFDKMAYARERFRGREANHLLLSLWINDKEKHEG